MKILSMAILLLILTMHTNAFAQSEATVVTADERLNNGPLFDTEMPIELGGGVKLLYAYVVYDGLTAMIFGEMTVDKEPGEDEVVSTPYLLMDATDTEGNALDTAGGNSIPSILDGTTRAPFTASVRTNGYRLGRVSVIACTSDRGLRPDLIDTSNVTITSDEYGSVTAVFELTNSSDIDLTEPSTDIAVYREDGLLVGSGYGFHSGTIQPGESVDDSIAGASWEFAIPTDNQPINLTTLTFEPTTYAANVPRSSNCTDDPVAISFIDAPDSLTDVGAE